jgi:hypothetical protein
LVISTVEDAAKDSKQSITGHIIEESLFRNPFLPIHLKTHESKEQFSTLKEEEPS